MSESESVGVDVFKSNPSLINIDLLSHDQFNRIQLLAAAFNENVDFMNTLRSIESLKLTEADLIPVNATAHDLMKELIKKDADFYNTTNIARIAERLDEISNTLHKRKRRGIPFGNRFELSRSSEFTQLDFQGDGHINLPAGVSIRSPGSKVHKLTIINEGSGQLEVGVGIISGNIESTSLFSIAPNDRHEVISDEKEICYVTLKSKLVDVVVNVIAEI